LARIAKVRAVIKVLFFCSGNTCRSPLAQGLAAARWPDLDVASAGLDAAPGCPASAGSCDQARDRGLNLEAHRSRRLEDETLREADWAVGMTAAHVARFRERFPDFRGRLGKLGRPGEDLRGDVDALPGEDVDDPWRKGTELAYDLMAEQVERLLEPWGSVWRKDRP